MFFAHLVFGSFLEDDEKILYIFRRPFLFFFTKFVFWATIAILVSGGLFFFYPQLLLICIGISSIIFLRVFMIFMHWYTNAIIMTNESIVHVDWPKLFRKRSTRIDFTHLDEITVEKIGISSFILNYGNVHFSKIGGNSFAIPEISGPNKVSRTIEKYREEQVSRKNFAEESTLKNIISGLVNTHVSNNGYPEDEKYKGKPEATPKPAEKPTSTEEHQKQESKPAKKIFFKRKNTKKFETLNIEIEKEFDDDGGVSFKL